MGIWVLVETVAHMPVHAHLVLLVRVGALDVRGWHIVLHLLPELLLVAVVIVLWLVMVSHRLVGMGAWLLDRHLSNRLRVWVFRHRILHLHIRVLD